MTGATTSISKRRRYRPAPLLAPGAERTGSLFAAMVAVSLVASLMVIGAVAAGRAAEDWGGRLGGSATVVVRAAGLESPDAAAARATEALGAMAGVARAWPLDAAAADPLIARLLDQDSSSGGEPRLVAVAFKVGKAPSGAELSRELKADGLDASVDDHRPLTSPILRAAALAGLTAAVVAATVVAAASAIAALATRRRLAAQGEVVDLLRLAGAADGFIGRLFWARSARMAAWAGVIGAGSAIVATAAWRLWGWAPPGAPRLAWADLAAGAAWPLAAALIGAVAAGWAVTAHLKGAP